MRRVAYWLTVAMVFTMPWENAYALPGGGSITRAVGLFAVAAWLLVVAVTRDVRRPAPPHLVALAFVGWNVLSVVWSINPGVSIGRATTFAQLFLMVYILWDTVTGETDVRRVLQAYVLGACCDVVALVGNYLLHGAAQYQNRFTLGTFEADDLGMVLALAVPTAWYLAMTSDRGSPGPLLRVVDVLAAPATLVGVMFSGSRAAMVATGPALVYIVASLRWLPRTTRVVTGCGAAGALLVLLPLVPADTIQRLTSTAGDRTQGDFDGRTELWASAYRTFQHNPLTGVGTGAFREESSWKVAHDVWLRMGAELGIVGLALMVLLFVMALFYGSQQRGLLRGFTFATVASLVIGATFYNLEAAKPMWLFLLLPVLVTNVAARGRDRLRPAPPPAPAPPPSLVAR